MLNRLFNAMVAYESGSPHRIQHFVKVHSFARHMGQAEGLSPRDLFVLEAAALVHDIGIRPALEKYGSGAGPLQEREGEPAARRMLGELGFEAPDIDRAAFLVGHHHTYSAIDGPDFQILAEADALVNWYENGTDTPGIRAGLRSLFRTASGIRLARTMFGLNDEEEDGHAQG